MKKEKPGYVPYTLTPFEKKLLKRDPIIAPDGQIPNSVIRSKIGKKIEVKPPVKERWVPKAMPQPEKSPVPPWWGALKKEFDETISEPVRVFSYTPSPVQPPTPSFIREDIMTPGSSITDTLSPCQSPQPWTWCDEEDDEKRETQTTPIQPTISPQSPTSPEGKRFKKLQPLPQVGKMELKSAKLNMAKVDLEFQEFPSGKKKKEPRLEKKSFKLTDMVVDENSTEVRLKPEEPRKKKKLPSVDLELLRRLLEEDWFPKLESDELSFELMLQKLHMLLETADATLHGKICDYIIEIQREIGMPDNFLDKMVDRLLTQTSCNDSSIRSNAMRTIRSLGIEQKDLLILLPKLVDSSSDVRLETEITLEELTGITDKEQLSDLMESLGIIKSHNGTADEKETLGDLEDRLNKGSESYGSVQHWIDSSSPTGNVVSNVRLEDVEKQWLGRSFQKTSGSLCDSDKGSRASDRLKDLSFSSGKEKSTLDKATSFNGYGRGNEPNGVTSSCNMQNDILKEEPRQSPTVGLDTQVSDISQDAGRVTEVDAYSQTDPELSEIPIPVKSAKTSSICSPDVSEIHLPSYDTNVSGYQDEFFTSKTEAELKSLCWSRDEESQNGGFLAQNSKSSLTLGKLLGPISDTERTDSAFSGMSMTGMGMSDIEGALSRNNSLWWDRESSQERTYDSGQWTPATPTDRFKQKTPYMRDISDDKPITDYMKKQLEVLQETSSVSGHSAVSNSSYANSRLRPTNQALYHYYNEQAKSANTTPNLKDTSTEDVMSTKKSRQFMSETDSDIHSMSAVPSSQEIINIKLLDPGSGNGDAKITDNAADTMSTGDSGIGQDRTLSDSVSLRKQRTKSIREKSLRDRGQPALSPVKSAQEISVPVPSNWREFFDTPTAQERKRMELVKREFDEGKVARQNGIPPISYISDEVSLLPAEEGLRLLHTVRVGERMTEELEERHQIQPIPGRLSMHTRNEDAGLSNFGIIQMQWTTGVPEISSKESFEQPTRQTTKSTAIMKSRETTKSHDTSLYLPQLEKLRKTRESRQQSSPLEEDFTLPHISGALTRSPDFQWEKPLPPPPAKESRTSIPYIRHEHSKYCHHYCLAKKRMHLFTSNIRDLCHLPEVIIKQALQSKGTQRSKKRAAPSRISRNDSVILPPISLRQLIRA